MESIVEKEFDKINLENLTVNECLTLSYLSMLRVWKILKYIYEHSSKD